MYEFDVVFIGSGHANWHAAMALVASGKRVAIVERDTIAGTCTNFGCNAKYLLDAPFDFVDGLEKYRGLGIDELPKVSWPELMAYKKANIGPMSMVMAGMFQQAGIEVVLGHGKLLDAHTVQAGERTLTAESIVLGTGEHPRVSDVPGKELLHDSRDFLSIDEFPARIAFIGAGIISMEFACIAAKMGSEVTVIHRSDRVLRNYPATYVAKLVEKMRGEGVTFRLGETVSAVEQREDGVAVITSGGEVMCDYVLDAIGRTPNVEGLGLEDVGIEFSARGIKVDDHLRTTLPNVYASGDCIDKRINKLTPTAEFESNYIATQLLGVNPEPIHYPAIPNLVFTLPRIAQVGVPVDEAAANPDRYRVERVPYGQILLFMAKSDPDADFTFVFDNETGDLVGAAIYGPDAGELVNVAAMVINLRLSRLALGSMIFTFPGTTYGCISMLMPHLKLA